MLPSRTGQVWAQPGGQHNRAPCQAQARCEGPRRAQQMLLQPKGVHLSMKAQMLDLLDILHVYFSAAGGCD